MNKIILVFILVGLFFGGAWFFSQRQKSGVSNAGETPAPTLLEKSQSVPLPTQEDIIRTYFNLISEKRIPEAVSMMSQKAIGSDANKQAWVLQLASLTSLKVEKIERVEGDSFRVDFQATVSPDGANLPIPYYGYSNGANTRFVPLVKEDGLWKIDDLATGP
jgi:hypothetical protein